MNAPESELTVIVRECGERTAEACVRLLQRIFPDQEIHRVSARPFSATLRLSLEKGLAEGRPWTLCIDADLLPLPELAILLDEARSAPEDLFELQGLVFDKLMTAPRAAGNHLYRTCLIGKALPLIPAENSLRPETDMIEAMAARGHPNRQSRTMIGLHDFEQSYCDIYAKAYLHGHKHRFILPLFRPLWQMLARMDADYRVALLAVDDALTEGDTPSVSRDFRASAASTAADRLGLSDKTAFTSPQDTATLRAWTERTGYPGEARTLSKQLASLIWRGLFPDSEHASGRGGARRQPPARPTVALVCANAYPLFDLGIPAVGGGMETRAALFGRGLSASGRWQLDFVVSDFGQDFVTRHEDIDFHIYQPVYRRAGRNVFPRLRKRRWFPVLNFDRQDLNLLWQIPMIAAWLVLPSLFFPRFWRWLRPDVVCCFGNNAQSAEVIADCRHAGIPTVLCVASDKDLSPDYRPGNRELNHYGMPKWKGHYALRQADRIVVQSDTQRRALREHFGRDGVLIRNPVHIAPDDPQYWLPRERREFILWIGRADDFNKRPMLFVQLARQCPGLDFLMIVSRTDERVFLALQGCRPPNLRILEHLPPPEIWDYLHRARALVNTSRFEGVPNTFLQAAVAGVPIVSLEVDPDGMLASQRCGIWAAGDLDLLRKSLEQLWNSHDLADALAATCHRHVLERHEASARLAEFEACIAAERQRSIAQPSALSWWQRCRRFVRHPTDSRSRDVN